MVSRDHETLPPSTLIYLLIGTLPYTLCIYILYPRTHGNYKILYVPDYCVIGAIVAVPHCRYCAILSTNLIFTTHYIIIIIIIITLCCYIIITIPLLLLLVLNFFPSMKANNMGIIPLVVLYPDIIL